MEVTVLDKSGKASGKASLELGAGTYENSGLIHLLVKLERNRRRQATASSKTRSEVRGGGAKPYRQKGTGRARQGTSRSPLKVGGGVIFGPRPKIVRRDLNDQAAVAGIKELFRSKEGSISVLDDATLSIEKTKDFKGLGIFDQSKQFVLVLQGPSSIENACRNLSNVKVCYGSGLNIADIVNADHVLLSKAAVEGIQGK